jgi:hypothetical protein
MTKAFPLIGKHRRNVMTLNPVKLIKSLLIGATYLVVFGLGWQLRKSLEPKPQPKIEATTQKTDNSTAHVKGQVKKKFGATGKLEEETIDFDAEISRALQSLSSVKKDAPIINKGDNLKFPINSRLQVGVEIKPVDNHWIGYLKDLKTGEDVYQYSYSIKLELPKWLSR